MKTYVAPTYWAKIYLSGPIEIAKQTIRQECHEAGLCVTIEPTTFIYTGGEESGYVVGLVNYPRFPAEPAAIRDRAYALMTRLLEATFQDSALLVTPEDSYWVARDRKTATKD